MAVSWRRLERWDSEVKDSRPVWSSCSLLVVPCRRQVHRASLHQLEMLSKYLSSSCYSGQAMESPIALSKGAKAFGGSMPLSRVAGVKQWGCRLLR
jgi:hypothetical protein